MNRLHISLLAAATGLLLMSNSGSTEAQQTVRCESQGGAYRSCPVSTSGGVTLSRQLSHEGCWQNDTWGYDRNRIWVTRGCRAEFRVGSYSNNNSDGAKVAGALVLGAIVAGAIAENKDNHHNDHRNDWDNDRYSGSYNGGYDYGYGNNGYYGNGNSWGREFTCASKDNRTQWCGNVARREHVEVRRQLSNTPCSFGRTWGVDRGQVWVSQGCRAVFVVY